MKCSVNFLFFTCCTCMIMLHYFLLTQVCHLYIKCFIQQWMWLVIKRCRHPIHKNLFWIWNSVCTMWYSEASIHHTTINEQQNNSTWHPQWYRCVCQLGHQLITSEENHYTFWQNNRDYHEDPSNVAYNLDKYCHRGCFGVLH